jgi:hypothetical protein
VWRPLGPEKVEVWCWFMIDKAAPEQYKEEAYRGYLGSFGPSGTCVISYFLFQRSRASDHHIEKILGERHDIIRKVDDQWKIASRTIYPDQTVLTVMNLSMFL